MNKVPTKALVAKLKCNKGSLFEVALSNGVFRATHFLIWGGKKIYDTGIDSQEVKWTPKEFMSIINMLTG